jgi:putative transposase
MLTLTYSFKLKPNKEQIRIIEQTLEVSRKVWNFALAERKDWYKSRKSAVNYSSLISEYIIPADSPYPNYNHQAKQLTLAKKDNSELSRDIAVLCPYNAQVLQQVLKRLDKAFTDMKDRNFGFPRFKKENQFRSYVYPQMLNNPLKYGGVKLPQLGWVKFRQSRPPLPPLTKGGKGGLNLNKQE